MIFFDLIRNRNSSNGEGLRKRFDIENVSISIRQLLREYFLYRIY